MPRGIANARLTMYQRMAFETEVHDESLRLLSRIVEDLDPTGFTVIEIIEEGFVNDEDSNRSEESDIPLKEWVRRRLRLLRKKGLIEKCECEHEYRVTDFGHTTIDELQ